jgi:hypothetical protein
MPRLKSKSEQKKMNEPRKINQKNQKRLPMFCLIVLLSVLTSFAQSQETPTGQQTQQSPPPTTNTTETPEQLTDKPSTFTYGAEMDFNSVNAWRGLMLDNRRVGQPSAWISAYGFTFTTWSNVAMTRAPGGANPLPMGNGPGLSNGAMTNASGGANLPPMGNGPGRGNGAMTNASGGANLLPMGNGPGLSNVVMTSASEGAGLNSGGFILTYERDWRKLKIETALDAFVGQQLSGIEVDFDARNTMEGSLKLSYPVGPLRIFTTQAFDVLAYRGSYFGEAGVEYERQVTKNTEFTISINSGWASAKFNDVYIGVNKSAFNYVGVGGSLTYYLGSRLYFRPHIEFSSITDRMLRQQSMPANIANFGIAFGFSK